MENKGKGKNFFFGACFEILSYKSMKEYEIFYFGCRQHKILN